MAKKEKTLNARINELMKEGPLVALYFSTGIFYLKDRIDNMDDKEVREMFHGLINPTRVRNNINYMFNELHPQ